MVSRAKPSSDRTYQLTSRNAVRRRGRARGERIATIFEKLFPGRVANSDDGGQKLRAIGTNRLRWSNGRASVIRMHRCYPRFGRARGLEPGLATLFHLKFSGSRLARACVQDSRVPTAGGNTPSVVYLASRQCAWKCGQARIADRLHPPRDFLDISVS